MDDIYDSIEMADFDNAELHNTIVNDALTRANELMGEFSLEQIVGFSKSLQQINDQLVALLDSIHPVLTSEYSVDEIDQFYAAESSEQT